MDTKALRQKVLDLAIRGKLVPQDPNDEPASVLLERIRQQKQQMVKEGKLKAKDIKNDTVIFVGEDNLHYEKFADGSVKCIEDEIPFDLPDGWAWARIATACIVNPRNSLPDDMDVSFIPMPLISDGYANSHSAETRKWKDIKSGFTHFSENDIGIAKITPCFENRKSTVFKDLSNRYGAGTTELHILRTIVNTVLPEYLLWIVKTDNFIQRGIQTFSGAVGQQRVGKEFVSQYLVPVPPHEEQVKIVAKLGEIFGIVTSVEQAKGELQSSIKGLKLKILNLAIRGQLVPQDPADEPASVLLERIRAEKEELIKQGKIKRDKKESVIFKGDDNSYYEKIGNKVEKIDDEIPFDLPNGWTWCRFSEVIELFSGQDLTPDKYSDIPQGIPYITGASNLENGCVIVNRWTSSATTHVTIGDLLLTVKGSGIGKMAICDIADAHIARQIMALRCRNGIMQEYLRIVISAFLTEITDQANGIIPGIRREVVLGTLFPLPPSSEQLKISAKANCIIAILQMIEKGLS